MGPVVDRNQEIDENIPKVLCQMDHHICKLFLYLKGVYKREVLQFKNILACVNVVRWSNNGLFLASGSDDKLIMIWQYVHGYLDQLFYNL